MTIKIYKFNNTFSSFSTMEILEFPTTSGMTISHYADGLKEGQATLNFEFVGVEEHIPYIKDIDFCTVIRKKIDFTALGANKKEIKNIGKNKGDGNHKDKYPRLPSDLPPGFKELYRK